MGIYEVLRGLYLMTVPSKIKTCHQQSKAILKGCLSLKGRSVSGKDYYIADSSIG